MLGNRKGPRGDAHQCYTHLERTYPEKPLPDLDSLSKHSDINLSSPKPSANKATANSTKSYSVPSPESSGSASASPLSSPVPPPLSPSSSSPDCYAPHSPERNSDIYQAGPEDESEGSCGEDTLDYYHQER